MARTPPHLVEARADLRAFARWLQARVWGRNVAYKRWKDLDFQKHLNSPEICQIAGELLREAIYIKCSCEEVPHLEACDKMKCLEWEIKLYDKWGFTRKSNSKGELKDENANVIPFPTDRAVGT